MIINTKQEEVVSSGIQAEGKFNIAVNSSMFDMLSSGVYKDKIKAVIRELSTNANDAHIEAGVTTPFTVMLPSVLEPEFSVRDYGSGMSEADVMGLYSTYGESTKRASNSFNGALGIGSKSPFSYTKAFSVVSRFDGMKKSYAIYVDNGIPTVAKTAEEICELDDTGLQVIVPVEEGDFHKFKNTATKVYQWFGDNRPDTGEELMYSDYHKILAGDDWYLFEDKTGDYYTKLSGIYVTMANVMYPVDVGQLGLDAQNTIGKTNMIIDVPTGAVRMAASRESLSMTPETIEYLDERCTAITEELIALVEEKVEEQDEMTLWEKTLFIKALADDYSLESVLEHSFPDYDASMQATVPHQIAAIIYPRYGRIEKHWGPASFMVEPKPTTKFVVAEKGYSGIASRAKNTNKDGRTILLNRPVGANWDEFAEGVKVFLDSLGNPPTLTPEDVGCYKKEKVIREKAEKKERVKIMDFTLNGQKLTDTHWKHASIKASEVDADTEISKVVYFPSNSLYIADKNWDMAATSGRYTNTPKIRTTKAWDMMGDIRNFIDNNHQVFEHILNKGIVFVTINKSERSIIKHSDKFVDIFTFVKEMNKGQVKVLHPDMVKFKEHMGLSENLYGGNSFIYGRETLFSALNKWQEEQGLINGGNWTSQLKTAHKLLPELKVKMVEKRFAGFSLNRLMKKYELLPYISYAGVEMYFKNVTKTLKEVKENEDF